MAIKARASRPSESAPKKSLAKISPKAVEAEIEEVEGELLSFAGPLGHIGVTTSRKLVIGSEDFFTSVTVQHAILLDRDSRETFDLVSSELDTYLSERIAALPDVDSILDGEEAEVEEAPKITKKGSTKKPAAKVEEEVEEEPAEGDEDPTEEEVGAMDTDELNTVIDEYGLDAALKKVKKLSEKRAKVIEELFTPEDGDVTEEETTEEDETETETEAEGDEAEVPYEEDELKAMKLEELQEIATAWKLKVPVPKGADLKGKKAAYVKAILADQEANAE